MKWIARWLWAPVPDDENWAQTLVRVLGNLFRIVITFGAVAGLIVAALAQLNNTSEQWIADERSRIIVTTSIDATNRFYHCTDEYPVSIAVRNDSNQTLMAMEIDLSARRRGTSTNLLSHTDRTVRWDHIVPPQHLMAVCYRLPGVTPASDMIVTGEPRSYSMDLRATAAWMLSETDATALATPPCMNGEATCEPWERQWEKAPSSQ